MKTSNRTKTVFTFAAMLCVMVAFSGSLHAEAVIYEPFADDDSPLNGNTPGLGLSGTWTGGYSVNTGNLSYGNLPTSTGNQVAVDVRSNARISPGSTLVDAGLLNDNSTLWFSILFKTGVSFGANPDQGFALGSNSVGNSNNIPMNDGGDGGEGIGFSVKNGQVRASHWDASEAASTAVIRSSGPGLITETTYLVVGEIIWGADGAASDTINVYLPDTDLNLGLAVSSNSGVLDQSKFDTISFGNKAAGLPAGFDEIRFGATYDDVIGVVGPVIPEPSTFVLAALGLLGLIGFGRRRRR